MPLIRTASLALLSAVCLAGWAGAEPSVEWLQPADETSSDRFSFTLTTPPLEVSPPSDGYNEVRLRSFASRSRRAGAPDLPERTVLVAIPPGTEPRLEFRVVAERLQRGVVPRPVPQRLLDSSADEAAERTDEVVELGAGKVLTRYAPDPALYEDESLDPPAAVRLGAIGVLRHQRYVEVQVAPVRWDPRTRALRVATKIEVTVRFDGAATGSTVVDPAFENIYRKSFVNYEQGASFRLGAERAVALEPLESASDAAPAGPGTPRRRLVVRVNGLVRLDHPTLSAAGFTALPISSWRLTNRGVQVPLQVQDDGDGLLEPGEWVQFYGQALDDEPKAVLNTDLTGTPDDIYEARDFSDENVYFLDVPGGTQPAMPVRASAPTFTRTPPTHFTASTHLEQDIAYRPLGGADPWYWTPTLFTTVQLQSRSETVNLPGLFSGTQPARVRVQVRGVSEDLAVAPDHLTRVILRNGSLQALAQNDGQFDGRTLFLHDFNWTFPGSGPQLTSPATVELQTLPVGGGVHNDVILDYVDVQYERSFAASGDLLRFDWPDGDAEFVVTGLTDSTPDVYEITRGVSPVIPAVRITGGTVSGSPGAFSVRFRVDNDPSLPDGTLRRFVVAGDAAAALPPGADFTADTISDLRNQANQADLIVIAHPSVLDASAGSPLSQLLAHRATAAGGGLTSKIARLDDIEDEFNFGLSGPLAIKEFLRWVLSDAAGEGWADPKPAYVLLLGDGSLFYKNGPVTGNLVPTQMMFENQPELGHYSSDNIMAAVVGSDPMPDLLLGRLPARTLADANTMLGKVLSYEQTPATGNWPRHSLFLSDRGQHPEDVGEALDWELTNDIASGFIPAPPYTVKKLRYWSDFYTNAGVPDPIEGMRSAIKSAINGTDGVSNGAALVQFIGHGNYFVWSNDAFWDERVGGNLDTEDLTNGTRLPWLIVHNCLNGGFHDWGSAVPNDSTVGENWLLRPGGGAVAVLSPSGLTFHFIGRQVTESIWDDLFGPHKERTLAVPVLNALTELCTQGSYEPCQNYVLLGDPATRLQVTSVDPAHDLSAGASNMHVDLSWTASATPDVHYDVYRATKLVPVPEYTKIGTTTSTTFPDGTVQNAKTYYYYVVAVDSANFESRWSNFNSDCASSGPDCVQATPLNPNPPQAPTGLQLLDPGTGTALTLHWSANPEPDIANYTLHYGVQPGIYPFTRQLGKGTSVLVVGLTEGQTYYMRLTATNTSSRTSVPSAEVSDYPVVAPGLKPPQFIGDLRVSKQGSDARLQWGEVTTDIYGKPLQVTRYEILRATFPAVANANMVQIGQCNAPCSSFLDPLALQGSQSYAYRVRAVGADGTRGALGAQYPEGTHLDLSRSPVISGGLRLTWNAVTSVVGGGPTSIGSYAIYASSTPFTRQQIRDGLLTPIQTTTQTTIDLMPPAQNQYYSVLAVDRLGNVSPY
ncbi:MAG TPA: C25 family cysteine peptidase [Candidatus Polarisedimenticolaceae bacterium]|nr:C25 family cysteine peptidase [Candidatus Polarisedimenticolaceae bacterium]